MYVNYLSVKLKKNSVNFFLKKKKRNWLWAELHQKVVLTLNLDVQIIKTLHTKISCGVPALLHRVNRKVRITQVTLEVCVHLAVFLEVPCEMRLSTWGCHTSLQCVDYLSFNFSQDPKFHLAGKIPIKIHVSLEPIPTVCSKSPSQ